MKEKLVNICVKLDNKFEKDLTNSFVSFCDFLLEYVYNEHKT